MGLWSDERLNVMRCNFKAIHPRCVLENGYHSRFSSTQFIYSLLTQQHVSALRDNLLISGMVDICVEEMQNK